MTQLAYTHVVECRLFQIRPLVYDPQFFVPEHERRSKNFHSHPLWFAATDNNKGRCKKRGQGQMVAGCRIKAFSDLLQKSKPMTGDAVLGDPSDRKNGGSTSKAFPSALGALCAGPGKTATWTDVPQVLDARAWCGGGMREKGILSETPHREEPRSYRMWSEPGATSVRFDLFCLFLRLQRGTPDTALPVVRSHVRDRSTEDRVKENMCRYRGHVSESRT